MSDTLKGVAWMIGTLVSFSSMAIAGRELAGILDTFEIMMYRSVVGIVIVLGAIALLGKWHEIPTRQPGWHTARNIAHFTGQNLWFYAVTAIPLAQVFALEFTSPLWVILLSPLVLGEKLTRTRALSAALGFVGILIVARPGAMTELNFGLVAAASCAVFFAFTIMLTKRLTRTDSVACILFYLTVIQLVLGLIAAGYDGDIAVPTGVPLLWASLVGVAGLAAHFCYVNALRLAPATIVAPIEFARLPMIALVAWLAYSETVHPLVFLGAAIIFAANYLNIWTETRKS